MGAWGETVIERSSHASHCPRSIVQLPYAIGRMVILGCYFSSVQVGRSSRSQRKGIEMWMTWALARPFPRSRRAAPRPPPRVPPACRRRRTRTRDPNKKCFDENFTRPSKIGGQKHSSGDSARPRASSSETTGLKNSLELLDKHLLVTRPDVRKTCRFYSQSQFTSSVKYTLELKKQNVI